MKNIVDSRRRPLKMLTTMSAVGVLAISQSVLAQESEAGSRQSASQQTQAQGDEKSQQYTAKDSRPEQQQSQKQQSQQQQAARNQNASSQKQNPEDFALSGDGEAAAGDRTAGELLDMEVVGKKGEDIGSVENLLINQQGQIVAIIAEVGGFLDIGDTHVAVPWNEISIGNDKVQAPITENNASEYSIFKEEYFSKMDVGQKVTVEDDLATGPQIWKATDLINDYVVLENNVGYGYVTDLTFNSQGNLQSVIVNSANPDFGYGYYAYPWYGYGAGWAPSLSYYALPYNERDLVVGSVVVD